MRLTVKITPHPNVLHVLAAGQFDLVDAARSFLEVTKVIDKHQSEKVIFDGRGVFGNVKAAERFYYGELVALTLRKPQPDGGYHAGPQIAYVLVEPVLDPARLGETVAVNRGANVKMFDDYEEAIQWLGVTQDDFADTGGNSSQ